MSHPVYATIDGPVIMIGFGSIGQGTLPLIERHFDFDKSKLTIIEPGEANGATARQTGYAHVAATLTPDSPS